jgi:hypothetical protein
MPGVLLSRSPGRGTVGQSQNPGTTPGTLAGHRYASAVAALQAAYPAYVDAADWQQAIVDADAWASVWATQAVAFDWLAQDLFGFHSPPDRPEASYRPLSRVDCTGLVWLMHGRPVITVTATEVVIQASSGALVYRKRAELV